MSTRRLPAFVAVAVGAAAVISMMTSAAHAVEPASPEPVNLARGGTATASSIELNRPDFAASQAIDGNPSTRWSSGYQDANWLTVRLATPSPVDHVTIDWPNACAREYALQVSTDGEAWQTVAERTGSTCARTDYIDVQATNVGYVRMLGAKRWSTYGYSISEIGIWDKAEPGAATGINVVPRPVTMTQSPGSFELAPRTNIVTNAAAAPVADYLADKLRPATGLPLNVTPSGAARGNITLRVAPGLAPQGHQEEGYHLRVTPRGVDISADTPQGALNAVQTLRQLLPQWIESSSVVETRWTLPVVSIADYPRYSYRSLGVDPARSFMTVAEVKEQIDQAAAVKLNHLRLHLTDDQGWRIAIENPASNPAGIDYGRLTDVSGRTAMTYTPSGALAGTELGHTGWYTQDDYREIVRYAAVNGMVVVPEVDMPGHTNAALHAIPELNSAGSFPKPPAGQPTPPHNGTGNVGYSSLDADNPATYEFVNTVLTQIAAMTPGPYLHIGGDEAHVTSHDRYVKMVDAFSRQATATGKKVVGWNEYSSADLPAGQSVIQYWYGNRAAVAQRAEATDSQVILSPAETTYIPQRQDGRQPNGGTWACGGPCTLATHYNWDPGTYLTGLNPARVLGVETVQWGEFMRGNDQVEFFRYPRALATAEVGWTPQSERSYGDFANRVAALGGRMALAGINHFPTADVRWRVDATASVTERHGAQWTVRATVTAPATDPGELSAELRLPDGTTKPVALTTPATTDIAAMRINGTWTGEATIDVSSTVPSRGAVLVVKRAYRSAVEVPVNLNG